MSIITKGLILLIFLVVIFGQGLFPSRAMYWSAYFVMFALVPALWFFEFWVSEKRARKVLASSTGESTEEAGKNADDTVESVFVGMVPDDNNSDLCRGRLCFVNNRIALVGRGKDRKVKVLWLAEKKDIRSVGFGTVAGVRKGFTLHLQDEDRSFVSKRIYKHRETLYEALGWEIREK